MSESTTAKPVKNATSASEPPSNKASKAAWVAVVLSLLALALAAYLIWQQQAQLSTAGEAMLQLESLRGELNDAMAGKDARLEQDLAAIGQSIAGSSQESADQVETLRAQITASKADQQNQTHSLSERVRRLESALEKTPRSSRDLRIEMGLNHVEYLMRLAQSRAQLAQDAQGAERALALADQQLNALQEPRFGAVQEALASARQALDQYRAPSRATLSGRLLTLVQTVDLWPLKPPPESNTASEDATDDGWLGRLGATLSQLVVVRRESELDGPWLSPDQHHLLRENLRLQLQLAQLAAARGDQALFHTSIDTAVAWLEQFYDLQAETVGDALATLQGMREQVLNPPLPDISQPLSLLRKLIGDGAGSSTSQP